MRRVPQANPWVAMGAAAALAAANAGCSSALPTATMGLEAATPTRALLAADAETLWGHEVRPDAPWTAFDEGPKRGVAVHLLSGGLALTFRATGAKAPAACEPLDDRLGECLKALVVRYTPNVPFTLRLERGADFALTDADATDGEATLVLPARAVTAMLTHAGAGLGLDGLGKPSKDMALTVTDPIYFQRQTFDRARLLEPRTYLNTRPAAFPWAPLVGPERLLFAPKQLESFGMRWLDGGEAVPPPLPPAAIGLSGPAERLAREAAAVAVVPSARWAMPAGTRFAWRVTDPENASTTPADTAASLAWTAPDAPGRYRFAVVAETPYFRARASADHTIEVYRECYLDTYAAPGQVVPDSATAVAADTWPLPRGRRYAFTIEGTMNPWGAATHPLWCGAVEPSAMYPSPNLPNGYVALDPAYWFATITFSTTPCPNYQPNAHNVLQVSFDNGATWAAPRRVTPAYTPTHRYAYEAVEGADAPMRLRFTDPRVWDNFGRFKVQIRRSSPTP